MAALRNRVGESAQWLIKAVGTFSRYSDPRNAARVAHNYLLLWKQASPDMQGKLKAMWQQANLGDWPEQDT